MRRPVLYLLLLTGCTTAPGPDIPSRPPAKLDQEFALSQGGAIPLAGTRYSIVFERVVEDSRCAIGTNCIWEGNARIVILLRDHQGNDLPIELNTSPRFPTPGQGGDLIVELRRLDPVPRVDAPASEYVATLLVRNR